MDDTDAMTTSKGRMPDICRRPHFGWPLRQKSLQVLSNHTTADINSVKILVDRR